MKPNALFLGLILTICSNNFFGQINFTDSDLKNALLDIPRLDVNFDNEISQEEANTVTVLQLDNKNISDLSGLENFTNLEQLYIGNNNLTTLDVSSFPNLSYLDFSANQVATIDVSGNSFLTYLDASFNNLSSIDIDFNRQLVYLDVSENNLAEITTTNNSRLNFLSLTGNPISDLNTAAMNNLQFLSIAASNIVTPNLGTNENLWSLAIDGLNTSSFGLDDLSGLRWLNASNSSYESLNFDQNLLLEFVDLSENNNLVEIVQFCEQDPEILQNVQIDETTILTGYLPDIGKVNDENFLFKKETNTEWLDCSVLSTQNFNNQKRIFMYPNPTSDYFEYQNFEPILVQIYGMDGKMLLQSKESKINVSHLPSGVYVVKARNESQEIFVQKLMIRATTP